MGTPRPPPVEDIEVEKVTDQGDGGHSGPEGWPRPCQDSRARLGDFVVASAKPQRLELHLLLRLFKQGRLAGALCHGI